MTKSRNNGPAKKRKANTTRGDSISARMRASRALALRIEGNNFREIGAALKCDTATAWRDVDRCIQELCEGNRETTEVMRTLEADRLDALHATLWPRALAGELPAVDRVLSIMARRARLFGLDTPAKIAVDAGDEQGDTPRVVRFTLDLGGPTLREEDTDGPDKG